MVFSLVWKNGWVGLEDLQFYYSFIFLGGGEGNFFGRFFKCLKVQGLYN